jgi:hypothetical protein
LAALEEFVSREAVVKGKLFKPKMIDVFVLDDDEEGARPFSVKGFVHRLFGMVARGAGAPSAASADAIFAFQERICTTVEMEVVMDDGTVEPFLLTRVNALLSEASRAPPMLEDVPLDDEELAAS